MDNKSAKLVARQQQKFLVLLSRDDFQKDIADLRAKWAIPTEGLTSPSEHEAWWAKHSDNADAYEDRHQQTDGLKILKAKRQWHAGKLTARQFDAIQAEVHRGNPVNDFYYDINQLIKRYRLPPRWHETLQTYLFTNKPRYTGPVGITIQSTFGREGEPDEISLKLDAHTTRQELINAWPSIRFHLDKLKHKLKAKAQPFDPEKLERNKLAHRLRQQGKKYEEIAAVLNKKYNSAYTYADIPTMIKNYRQLLGMN